MNDKKLIIAIIVVTLFILGGSVALLGSSSAKVNLEKTVGAQLVLTEQSYDFKEIPINGGVAQHSFVVKNNGDKELKIASLATSCACTKVFFKKKDELSPQFGMKGMSKISNWVGVLKPNEEGEIVAIFDPLYHGPQGIGPIDRLVSFETNDPDKPYVELSFKAVVIK